MTPAFYAAQPWFALVAALIAAGGVARATRLIVHEDYPPARWLRRKVIGWLRGGEWTAVVTCHWCNPPYLMGASLAWFALGLFLWEPLIWAWWAVHAWAALSYLASWMVHHDEDGPSTG
jgi:4-hydroxybenzoate polyprenyltransferase